MDQTRRILVVDDSADMRTLLRGMCERLGFRVDDLSSGEQVLALQDRLNLYDAVILDLVLPGIDGFETLQRVRELRPGLPIIMATVRGDRDSVERALALGATDFIPKPVDAVRLRTSLANAWRMSHLLHEVTRLNQTLSSLPEHYEFSTSNASMQALMHRLHILTDAVEPLLFVGEPSVGKESLARLVHTRSSRAKLPMVVVRCDQPSALASLQSLRGSTLAAPGEREEPGAFEIAGGGTVFLDHIDSLPRDAQSELNKILQLGQVARRGTLTLLPVKARIMASAARPLDELALEGNFSEELSAFLMTEVVNVPSLRDRQEDLEALANFFLQRARRLEKLDVDGFSEDAMHAIQHYDWPGNLTQIRNVIHRCAVNCKGNLIELETIAAEIGGLNGLSKSDRNEVGVDGLISAHATMRVVNQQLLLQTAKLLRDDDTSKTITERIRFDRPDAVMPLARIERAAILAALRACGGDIQETARRLEISRATIYRRLHRYGITPDSNR